jgi:uncharacterized protein (DUF433 family)
MYMQTPQDDNSLYTPTEAAVLADLSLKAVNNAIDKKFVVARKRAGKPTRMLGVSALVALVIGWRFAPEQRRKLFDALAAGSRNVLFLDDFLKIDVRAARRELATREKALRRASELVIRDPEILGGDPVFRGTRIPVHQIAGQIEQGASEAELLSDYPRLKAEMIPLASLYAKAYPLRGRPRKQPWHNAPPVHQSRRKLASV